MCGKVEMNILDGGWKGHGAILRDALDTDSSGICLKNAKFGKNQGGTLRTACTAAGCSSPDVQTELVLDPEVSQLSDTPRDGIKRNKEREIKRNKEK